MGRHARSGRTRSAMAGLDSQQVVGLSGLDVADEAAQGVAAVGEVAVLLARDRDVGRSVTVHAEAEAVRPLAAEGLLTVRGVEFDRVELWYGGRRVDDGLPGAGKATRLKRNDP